MTDWHVISYIDPTSTIWTSQTSQFNQDRGPNQASPNPFYLAKSMAAAAASSSSFAFRWGGLAVWADEGVEPGASPYFDPQGYWTSLPLVLAMCLVGAACKALEARWFGAFDAARAQERGRWRREITSVMFTGALSRALLVLLLWAPPAFIRKRWDWVCTAPVTYETLAFVYYWGLLPPKFKWVVVGHHAVVLAVVWPMARCVLCLGGLN
jgi:hypothetical protein